ncbi:hypothetical protein SteCoe_10586 [Stentor coeruleus]|uniref:Kinesin motor domain-containing protein n=1 Tax=Stentor coeruleus TaxID=5963 RepID=A0A1R2CFD9_9CILI|nr:hypothetical protein SteCoe_10586 [Stentor coeruleus]
MSNSSSVKVTCRVRPLMDFEATDISNQEIVCLTSDTTIGVGEGDDLETFTFDKVFGTRSTQEELYNFIGKATIEDVMSGYNGTIFAYGQTGSGKTHTMLGSLYDQDAQGIIPRAANQIFEEIEKDENEIEFTLKCSLLEIYKETLRDLLDVESSNLQIKECPRRGIYVKGLTEVCITSEKELIDLLCLGQQLRTVACTRLNSTSSRSHFIFFLEVIQKLPNDSEKKGILNLVDLAGSEKVNNSGVTGNCLEEAKKINLSLSALGKVINALIHNHDHIPYRDSKLTRILQESLGGNFKTTLLVTCSPAARSQSETIDSLRFAVRAKAIKNKATINMKNPPENYIKIIEMLRSELLVAKNEIKSLKLGKIPNTVNSTDRFITKIPISSSSVSKNTDRSIKKSMTPIKPVAIPKNRRACSSGIDLNSLSVNRLPLAVDSDISCLITQEKSTDESMLIHNNLCKDHETEIERLKEQVNSLKSDKEFLQSKIEELEGKLLASKNKQLGLEQRAHEYYHYYSSSINVIHKDATEISVLRSKNEHMQKQLQKMISALEAVEAKHKRELEEFKNFKENTILEFKEDPETGNYRSDIPVITMQPDETKTLSFSSFMVSCDPTSIISPYSENLKKALEDPNFFNKEYTIYILKQQILQAAVANSELTSSLSNMHWKLSLLKHKYNMKRELCTYQQEHIKKLEEIVDHLHESYSKIVNLTEKIEFKTINNAPKPKLRTLKSFSHKQSFTSRSMNKKITDTTKNITCNLIYKLDETNLGIRFKELESNLDLQSLFNTQLKRNNDIYKSQAQKYAIMLDEIEKKSYCSEKAERERWKKIFLEFRENAESELARKQEEIIRMNDVLGGWVNSFMALQEANGCQKIKDEELLDLMVLVKRTGETLESINANTFKFSFCTPIIPSKPCSPFLMSFKGDLPVE